MTYAVGYVGYIDLTLLGFSSHHSNISSFPSIFNLLFIVLATFLVQFLNIFHLHIESCSFLSLFVILSPSDLPIFICFPFNISSLLLSTLLDLHQVHVTLETTVYSSLKCG